MKKKILYLFLFVVIGFVLINIPFTNIIGSGQKFSVFDFFAPTIGMFLASAWGAISVIVVKLISALVNGQSLDTATIIRFFPLALAALYFGARKYKFIVATIPLICMALFIMHPEGRGAWYYSLYWLIPIVAVFNKKSLIMNSLGATFTAHAIGSVAFLFAFNLPSAVWIGLIPIVFLERMLFTGGIAVSYVVMNTAVDKLAKFLENNSLGRMVNKDYVFSKRLSKNL
ncbi:MAG: hypothetical protein ACNFW9_02670 [Candidatus Kerfeldbacteria bacterium]|jgi:hypothetical protein